MLCFVLVGFCLRGFVLYPDEFGKNGGVLTRGVCPTFLYNMPIVKLYDIPGLNSYAYKLRILHVE